MDWKGRRVLVTGASGFIGSHLTELLINKGARVQALIHYNSFNTWGHLEHYAKKTPSNLSIIAGDIRDPHFVSSTVNGHEIIFHLAALISIPFSYIAPQLFIDTNVTGTLHILEAARRAGVSTIIQTSTSEVYGTAQYVPIDEKHPLQGQSPYSASKIASDQLALSFHRSFNVPVIIVRPFNTFGPHQSARAIIPTILCQLLAGATSLSLGDRRPVRDFTYVEDTVRGFLAAAEHGTYGSTINIGSGQGYSVQNVVEKCATVLQIPKPKIKKDSQRLRPVKSEVWKLICDNRLAHRNLKWSTKISFEEGLERTATYIRSNMQFFKEKKYNT